MNLDFLQNRYERAGYLASLMSSRASGGSADPAEYLALRGELIADAEIAQRVPSFVRLNRDLDMFWAFIKAKFSTYAERRTFISEQFTPLLDYLELIATDAPAKQQVMGQGVITMKPSAPPVNVSASNPGWLAASAGGGGFGGGGFSKGGSVTPAAVARNKRKVFIVHGRDDAAKQEVARFVADIGLEPIILHEQASQGMTIIEKIERYTNDADFALVLYTPCDRGRGGHETKVEARNRARQNVVFEHGFLMAKLGRENVCALVKGEIETPNDISGVVYVPLDAYGGWKEAVIGELVACGYAIKR